MEVPAQHDEGCASPVPHGIAAERDLWDACARSPRNDVTDAEPVFRWTQYEDHGPGVELLGAPGVGLDIGHIGTLIASAVRP